MSETARLPRSSGWMVSPSWDLAFIVASPVVIVPVLWLLARSTLTPEQLAIPVFAFATLGHHLPGYMRAYGDRTLFERFKLRFTVVPPILFGAVVLLVQPSFFGLDFAPPSSLQLLVIVWGAWHGLMQVYGFMRLYDARQGGGHGRSQRLDLAACFAIFVGGFLFSDSRSFALIDLAWRAGLPSFGPDALAAVRLVAGIAIGLLAVAYPLNLLRDRRRGRRMGGVKLALAAATGGIYTFSGLVTTNLLVGAAMFEVFHAVQYLAIVWYFNRRLEDRVGDGFGPLRFLFRDRWSSLLLYLAAVAAFGSIFLTMGTPRYGPLVASGEATDTLYVLFSAFFVTSSLLHYYYDGFIWKLHDRQTGRDLGVTGPGLREMSVPALRHGAKWGALVLAVGALVALEVSTPATPERAQARVLALGALTPNVPEARSGLLRQALEAGRTDEALDLAERNLALRPSSHHSYADLGRVHVARSDWPAAESAYREAIALRPVETAYHSDLARVLVHQGESRLGEAALAFEAAISRKPDDGDLHVELAAVEQARGRLAQAAAVLEAALEREPGDLELRARLASVLLEWGDHERALAVAAAGSELFPDSALAQQTLGLTLLEIGRPAQAVGALEGARSLDPTLHLVDYQLARAQVAAGQYRAAEQSLLAARRDPDVPSDSYVLLARVYSATDREPLAEVARRLFVESAPDPATGYRTLGARLAALRDYEGAEAAYLEALRYEPDHAATQARLAGLRARQR